MCLREIISNSYHAPLSALYPRRRRRLPALSSLFLGPAVCCKHRTAGFSHTVHKIETHDVLFEVSITINYNGTNLIFS